MRWPHLLGPLLLTHRMVSSSSRRVSRHPRPSLSLVSPALPHRRLRMCQVPVLHQAVLVQASVVTERVRHGSPVRFASSRRAYGYVTARTPVAMEKVSTEVHGVVTCLEIAGGPGDVFLCSSRAFGVRRSDRSAVVFIRLIRLCILWLSLRLIGILSIICTTVSIKCRSASYTCDSNGGDFFLPSSNQQPMPPKTRG